MDEDVVSMQDIFLFEKRGIGPGGKVLGRFHATGILPKFAERLKASGIMLPVSLFDHSVEV
jgi:pilus assembly protein CpaF